MPLEGWVYSHFGGVDNLDETGKGPVPRYLTALYYSYATMTTVGYGDISATTSVEMFGAIVAMVVGTIVFSLTVGMLQAILRAGNPEGRLKYKQINRLVGLMRGRGVSIALSDAIQKYFTSRYNHETAIAWNDVKVLRNEHFLLSLPEYPLCLLNHLATVCILDITLPYHSDYF